MYYKANHIVKIIKFYTQLIIITHIDYIKLLLGVYNYTCIRESEIYIIMYLGVLKKCCHCVQGFICFIHHVNLGNQQLFQKMPYVGL